MKISNLSFFEKSSPRLFVWMMPTRSLLLFFLLLLSSLIFVRDVQGIIQDDDSVVAMTWHLCPASNNNRSKYQQEGELLSTFGAFHNNHSRNDCMPAKVPGTVLSILLDNGVYNNSCDDSTNDCCCCYYETNLESIPDIYDTGPAPWTFFYVANFTLLPSPSPSPHKQHVLLELRSINYKAELWLDGSKVIANNNQFQDNVPDPQSVQGMFQRFRFPLGKLAQECDDFLMMHHLAILVHPPPHPGKPGGGQGGSTHELAQDGPISQFTAGWDWIQATPDRNTGLWDKVTLRQTGRFQLKDPFVKVSNIIRNKKKKKKYQADLEFEVQIDCRDEEEAQEFHSSTTIVHLEYHVVQNSNSHHHAGSRKLRHVQLNPKQVCNGGSSDSSSAAAAVVVKFPMERLKDAQLWYPHTHGSPTLYQATIRVGTLPGRRYSDNFLKVLLDFSNNNNSSMNLWDDQVSFSFGIRKVEFTVNSKLNGLQATINNQRVFLQGGNWIATDQLMRFIGNKKRYQAEIALHKAMGFNMIRVWGGGITERPEFFDICDQLGILVLSDLWMSGDNNGRWAGSYSWPTNHSLYLNAVRDTFLLLRNHPSLVMYSAGNELYPTDKNPPPDILTGIRKALREIDPDTLLVASTMTNWTDYDPQNSLCPKDGPYKVMEEAFYYERNPGLYDWKNHEHYRLLEVPIAFQPEIGSASFPTLASLRRFMSTESLNAIPGYQDSNVHPTWQYHNFLGFTSQRNPYAKDPADNVKVDLIYQYGPPANISEYTIRAQLVQFTQFRTLFESFRFKMFEWYTAVLFWKSQSPWPSLRGGLYDWYLGMTGGYYGVRAALLSGTPSASVVMGDTSVRNWWVHGQMNLMDHSVAVITTTPLNDENATPDDDAKKIQKIMMVVRVQVDAYHLAGCKSGQHLYSHTMYATVTPNAVYHIPNSTLPFVGDDNDGVTLYRITTTTAAAGNANDETIPIESKSVSEYWLSNWTAASSSASASRNEIPVQDLSSLGEWREDTSRHVALDVSAMYCGYCRENDGGTILCHDSYSSSTICQAAGCSHSEIAVRLTNHPYYYYYEYHNNNSPPTKRKKSNCGDSSIAFAVWTELHTTTSSDKEETVTADAKKKQEDTRILPTLYSNGLFSILRNETRYVCMDPSFGQNNGNSEISKLQVHVSGWNVQDVIVPVQETQHGLDTKRQI